MLLEQRRKMLRYLPILQHEHLRCAIDADLQTAGFTPSMIAWSGAAIDLASRLMAVVDMPSLNDFAES
jgi:hypothetical protein